MISLLEDGFFFRLVGEVDSLMVAVLIVNSFQSEFTPHSSLLCTAGVWVCRVSRSNDFDGCPEVDVVIVFADGPARHGERRRHYSQVYALLKRRSNILIESMAYIGVGNELEYLGSEHGQEQWRK